MRQYGDEIAIRFNLIGWRSRGQDMDFVAELWRFMRVRKKFWLLPTLVMMVVFGGLVVLTKGSAIAPFIYTLF
jgi:hypothetical protein